VKQESIRKFNKLENWEQPQAGEAVFLNSVRNTYMKTRTYYELQKEREKLQREKIENDLRNTIKPQKIYIQSPKDSTAVSDAPKTVIHIVKAKETIFSLAKKYGCTPAEINKWNNLDDAPLQLGQKLTIKLNE
jgi:LysM repeat protein